MTEKGQQVFKWVVWITLIATIFFNCYRWLDKIFHPDLTKTEWMEMLDSKIDRDYIEGYGDEIITGKDIAILSMKSLGEKRLEYLIEGEITEEKLIDLADELNIVNKGDLEDTYNEKDAEKVLSDLTDYYSDPDTYPVYDKTEYTENVIFTDGWDITSTDSNIITVNANGESLEPGKILLIENELGIAEARKIITCENESSENEYIITTTDIDSLSEVASHISFSGYADFSHLENINAENKNINLFNVAPLTAHAAEIDKATKEIDLEFGFSFFGEVIDNMQQDSLLFTVKVNGVEVEKGISVLEDEFLKNKFQPEYKYTGKEVSIGGTVTIEDLSIVASGEWNTADDDDKNNTVSITVNCDTIFDINVNGQFDGYIPVPFELEFPIKTTSISPISVKAQPYIIIGAGGEISMKWEILNIRKGIEYIPTNETPINWINEGNSPKINFYGNVHFDSGIKVEPDVYIFKYKLADPNVDIRARINAETQGINPGFEEYPPCIDVGLFAPIITLEASDLAKKGEECSALAKIMHKLQITATWEAMTEENAWLKMNQHIEFEKDGTINKPIEGLSDEVCTRVMRNETEDDIFNDFENSLDDFQQAQMEAAIEVAKQKIKEEIQVLIDEFMLDNCG